MGNSEHLSILKQGIDTWNKWRNDNPEVRPDLSDFALIGKNLRGVNLSETVLTKTDFTHAQLRQANFYRAILFEANLTLAVLTEANLSEALLIKANFNKANLTGANLRGANMRWSSFSEDSDRIVGFVKSVRPYEQSDLQRVNLSGADLSWAKMKGVGLLNANLSGAILRDTDLRGASLNSSILKDTYLQYTNLSRADLQDADLSGADLQKANLSDANLQGVNLNNAIVGYTDMANVDLSSAKSLESVQHSGPSMVGIDTIFRSRGQIPPTFLRGCGVPDNFIEYMTSMVGKAVEYYSCFISYSSKDENFAKYLYDNLQDNGVRTWYFPEDAKWGATVWGEIDRSIKIYDKLVVVCSVNSLQSVPVLREIDRALNREDKEGKNVLFPIRIDDYIFDGWEHERKADILRKVVGDFNEWNSNIVKYKAAFEKLLKGLKAK